MSKESSGNGPKGNSGGSKGNSGGSKGNSGGSKGNSGGTKGNGGNTKGASDKNTKGSGGDSKGLGNVGWGGGDKGPNLGGGSYNASTGFGKGDTGSSFGGSFSKGSDKGTTSTQSNPKQATQATSSLDAAFKNFKQDTVNNTQMMQGQLYTKVDGGWKNMKTGQSIEGKHIDRQAATDSLKQDNLYNRGYDDLTAIKNWFSDLNPFGDEEKATGPSPLGGWASYGGAIPGQEDPRGFFDKLGASFTQFGWNMMDSPLKTISDIATNPMVTTAASFLGGLPAIAAIKGASILSDVTTGVTDTLTAAKETAKATIGLTPAGAALGEFRGIATAAVDANVGAGIGGFVGGKVGTGLGDAIGSALSSNPYGAAIGSMVGGTIGSFGGTKMASSSAGAPSNTGPTKESGKNTPKSPLVSRGDTQIASAPQAPEADPLKYVRDMQLPFYGPNYQFNAYGIPNTMIGA